jgi:UPF0716 protein FxsA
LGRLLFIIFLIVPLIEIALFMLLVQAIGIWPTLLGIVVTALLGSAIIRRQGISLIDEIRRLTNAGMMPAKQIAEGLMLAVSGALLLTPGYFTDACGFLLLIPAVRLVIYNYAKSRINVVASTGPNTSNPDGQGADDGVIDLDRRDWRDEDE